MDKRIQKADGLVIQSGDIILCQPLAPIGQDDHSQKPNMVVTNAMMAPFRIDFRLHLLACLALIYVQNVLELLVNSL